MQKPCNIPYQTHTLIRTFPSTSPPFSQQPHDVSHTNIKPTTPNPHSNKLTNSVHAYFFASGTAFQGWVGSVWVMTMRSRISPVSDLTHSQCRYEALVASMRA